MPEKTGVSRARPRTLTITMSADEAKQLEDLAALLGMSLSQTIRSSVKINKRISEERDKGADVLIKNKNEIQTLVFVN